MYSKRRSLTKIDRSKLRRSVPIMDYNVMAKGKRKLLMRRQLDFNLNITSNLRRRKFEGRSIQKINKMVLLSSGKYPLMCSESLSDNSSVHTRSMTRQHSFIGSIYNKVLYNEELKVNGQNTSRDSTEFPLWPEGDKTVSNVMLDSLNHVLQFCSTYQKSNSSKRKIIVTPRQSHNKMDKHYFTSQTKYKQIPKLKINDQRHIEWKIDENGLEYKTIKISLPSDYDKLSSDDDVFVKPQDPSHYKALNKDYINTFKKFKGKEVCKIPETSVNLNSDMVSNCDNKAKSCDSTIIIIDDDDNNDDDDVDEEQEPEINDCEVPQSLYSMVMNTSLLYCMLCGVPVTETTNYINNFKPDPL